MGKRGFIAYDPFLAREKFNADMVIAIYYLKLLRYDEVLTKDADGFFKRSMKQIEQDTCIKRRQQERARNWLESHNLIITKVKVPEKRNIPYIHFKIIDKITVM